MINQFNAMQTSVDADYFIREYYGPGVSPTFQNARDLLNLRLNVPTIGASGAVFGCLAAFGYLFPNTYINVWFILPIKAKWFVLLYMAVELFATFKESAGDNVAHLAHLGGALFGFLLVWFWNKKNRRNFY
jgi:membrane associated rhomboid family serine protease